MVRQLKWKIVDFVVSKQKKLRMSEYTDELTILSKAGAVWRLQVVKCGGETLKDDAWWMDVTRIKVKSTKMGGIELKHELEALRLMEAL